MQGRLFSVALSLGLPPPGVTRHRCFVESGLSSRHLRTTRPSSHPRCLSKGALLRMQRSRQTYVRSYAFNTQMSALSPELPDVCSPNLLYISDISCLYTVELLLTSGTYKVSNLLDELVSKLGVLLSIIGTFAILDLLILAKYKSAIAQHIFGMSVLSINQFERVATKSLIRIFLSPKMAISIWKTGIYSMTFLAVFSIFMHGREYLALPFGIALLNPWSEGVANRPIVLVVCWFLLHWLADYLSFVITKRLFWNGNFGLYKFFDKLCNDIILTTITVLLLTIPITILFGLDVSTAVDYGLTDLSGASFVAIVTGLLSALMITFYQVSCLVVGIIVAALQKIAMKITDQNFILDVAFLEKSPFTVIGILFGLSYIVAN